jgi:hypothetical protein
MKFIIKTQISIKNNQVIHTRKGLNITISNLTSDVLRIADEGLL